MHISKLHVENFRNLTNQVFPLSDKINLIIGENGAGKTSLLEAIYFLGRQRSFRTAKPRELVQRDKNYFRIIAKTIKPNHQIGVERRLDVNNLSFQCHIDRKKQRYPSILVKTLPIIAITTQSFSIINTGPRIRRNFIDYSCLHFDNTFLKSWQGYQKVLKNRNAALRQKMANSVIDSFTSFLVVYGEQIDACRRACFLVFKTFLSKHLEAINFPYNIDVKYLSGWNLDDDLSTNISKNFAQDYNLGYTRFGPHRADIKFEVEGGNANNRLSRGQQKSLILALHLAQIDLIGKYGNTLPLLIFDDIASELDAKNRNSTISYLTNLNCQMFFSTTEDDFFSSNIRKQIALIRLKDGTII